MVLSLSEFISKNTAYLTQAEMQKNVRIIYTYFSALGWTDNAIAGMIGNMETESTINPGLWQGREIPSDPLTTDKGFGLTQWTPANKLINWANESGLDYTSGFVQMQRINFESLNNLQWSTENLFDYTWEQYIHSTESPEDLAQVFVWAYERPENPDIDKRRRDARKWFEFFKRIRIPIWLLFKLRNGGLRRG